MTVVCNRKKYGHIVTETQTLVKRRNANEGHAAFVKAYLQEKRGAKERFFWPFLNVFGRKIVILSCHMLMFVL